jgi:hypothetical protein
MQGLLITIAVILIALWLIGFVFHVVIGTIGLAIHFAPIIAIILIVYVLLKRKNSV